MDYYFFFVFSKNLDNVNTPKWKRRAHKIREMPELKIETNAGLQVSSQPFYGFHCNNIGKIIMD